MECKSCGYALWNLKARQCPECGQSFLPSEFEFVKNSVQFCCPHCDQPYYGTGEHGHLEPAEFDCVRCGEHIHMDDCVLRPTAGLHEDQTRPDEMPWLDRQRTGKPVRAFFSTIGRSMGSPVQLMRGIRGEPQVGQALWFAALMFFVPTFVNFVPIIGVMVIAGASTGGGIGAMTFMIAPWFGMMIVSFIMVLLWIAVVHFIVAISGERAGGIGRTTEAIAYASGPQVLTAIPCLGVYLSPVSGIWWMINSIFTLRERQAISSARACFAVLPGPILLMLLLFGLMIGSVMWSTATIASMQAIRSQAQLQSANQELLAYLAAGAGQYPPHGAYLFTSAQSMSLEMYMSVDPMTVPVGEKSLAEVMTDVRMGRDFESTLRAAAEALPDDVVAHRVGGLVFTYHGINQLEGDTFDLWTMVKKLTPTSPVYNDVATSRMDADESSEVVIVATAGGTVQTIPIQDFEFELEIQNQLRAQHGLPPLPDPDEVTYDKPGTATNVGAGSGDDGG